MKELIKITENDEGVQTVNAKDLHEFLEIKKDFSNWIKYQIESVGFKEELDFSTILARSQNNRKIIEYHITINMAKELSMLARNEKGKKARQYFIECETRLKKVVALTDDEFIEKALSIATKRVGALKLEIEVMTPKALFYDQVTESPDYIDMKQVCKVAGIDLGRNKLFIFLRKVKVLMKNNEPYQSYVDKGFFRLIESSYYDDINDVTRISIKTVVSQKGIEYIIKLINSPRYKIYIDELRK